MMFGPINQEPLGLTFDAMFQYPEQFTINAYITFQNDVDNFEIEYKTC